MLGKIIQNGVTFDPKNWKKPMVDFQSIDILFSLLEERQISYLLVGGVAMLAYVEGRNTQDIAFLISTADLDQLPELLISSRDRNFARADFGGLQIDLLLTSNPLFALAMEQYAGSVTMGDRSIRCITPAGLLLLKLYALPSLYRQGQFQRANLYESDLTALLIEFSSLSLDQCFPILRQHLLASDIESLQPIAHDINQRVRRFQQ